jgi:Esterase-like activity of phytase
MARRPLLFALLICVVATCAKGQTLTYRNFQRLPDGAAPGLSGITYAGGDAYWGVLEWEAKLLRLRITTGVDGSIESVKIERAMPLPKGRDFEGVALSSLRPDAALVSTEEPQLLEVSLKDGRRLGTLPLPEVIRQRMVRHQGLESLACSTDGKTVWTATERALVIDGNPQVPVTPILAATRVRLQRFELLDGSFAPREQFEYQTSGVHGAGGQIGLCDLAALPDGRLLALERSAAKSLRGEKSIRTRIFLVDVTGATDVSQPPYDAGLVSRSPVKVAKTLLYDGFVCDADGENTEGLCVGPELGPGRWTVLGVVDNTDGGMGVSQPAVVAFELDLNAPPTMRPSTQPLVP